jgi:hypothetical protein
MMSGMTAQPVDDYDPDDPVEILSVLPGGFHEQFLAEYDAAVADARRPEQYRQLHQEQLSRPVDRLSPASVVGVVELWPL